jgi:hypothetical protein
MAEPPHIDDYSIPARICAGFAIVGGLMLFAVAVSSWYFMP